MIVNIEDDECVAFPPAKRPILPVDTEVPDAERLWLALLQLDTGEEILLKKRSRLPVLFREFSCLEVLSNTFMCKNLHRRLNEDGSFLYCLAASSALSRISCVTSSSGNSCSVTTRPFSSR